MLAIGLLLPPTAEVASAQMPLSQSAGVTAGVEMEPIRCWSRTSAGAVRVGETFSLVLTCAVVDTQTTTVVPDLSQLEPTVLQLPPFEVIGGTHAEDLRAGDRRFFQYEYTLRLIKEDQFTKDVRIPQLQINYRIRNRVQGAASVQGQERFYLLPARSIRVLSLVPADASDIREIPTETFRHIGARRFYASVLLVVGGSLLTLAGLLLVLAMVPLFRRDREQPIAKRLISDRVVLRGIEREFSDVRRQRSQEGWTEELARRALTTFRIAGGHALLRRVSQVAAHGGANGHDGRLLLRYGWMAGKEVLVWDSTTAASVARQVTLLDATDPRREQLEELLAALSRLTAARYGRVGRLDEKALDESLTSGVRLVRRLRFENNWVVSNLHELRRSAAQLGNRVWPR